VLSKTALIVQLRKTDASGAMTFAFPLLIVNLIAKIGLSCIAGVKIPKNYVLWSLTDLNYQVAILATTSR
jgi:hypothetical protein